MASEVNWLWHHVEMGSSRRLYAPINTHHCEPRQVLQLDEPILSAWTSPSSTRPCKTSFTDCETENDR